MTRWVRSGSSQKHKKMPGNATKWGEFDNQYARQILPKRKKNFKLQTDPIQKFKSQPANFPSNKTKDSLDDFFCEDKCCFENTGKVSEDTNNTFDESHSNIVSLSLNNKSNNDNFPTDKTNSPKIKKKKKQRDFDSEYSSLNGKTGEIDYSEVPIRKKMKLENDHSIITQNDLLSEQDDSHVDFAENSKSKEESFSPQRARKKRKKKKVFDINSENLVLNDKIGKKKKKKQRDFDSKYSLLNGKTDEIDYSEVPIHKKMKLENDHSIIIQNDLSEQDDSHADFAENSKSKEESFSPQRARKKRRKKKKSDINCENLVLNDKIEEISTSDHISFDHSNEFFDTKQDTEYCNSSDKTSQFDKFSLNINSSKIQENKKHDKKSSDSNQSLKNNESCKKSSSKVFQNKKQLRLKKLKEKREKLGLLPLPRNTECKLHKIKKRLIEKGLPPEEQKEIMRQVRRKEELKFRKVFNPSKLCFGCREPGHVLADCPQKLDSLKQETGICFKCGSIEHTSYKCPEKVQGFPYAQCFICKEQGHISRECPKNKHGVYPKGGRCKLCGNVNHLKKDCPTLKKKENGEEETFTLHTLNEDTSIDAEVVKNEKIVKKHQKKTKIVKF